MSRLKNYLLGAGVALGAMVLAVGVPAAAAAVHVGPDQVFSGEVKGKSMGAETTAPHITARPTDVMVNSPVALHGTGFPPAATLRLQECSLKNWIVPEDPCLTTNSVTVTTNSRGGFTTTMKALICPAVTPPVLTRRTCYIGVPRPSGIDTITLVGAARIVVSWP
jgi:hypothetical protein